MNKNVIYYSLNIPDFSKIGYYSMLYHSLHTLKKYYEENKFDVVVYYNTPCFKDFSFEQYTHLNKFKIVEAFPFVKFIKSDYPDVKVVSDYSGPDWYMTKWYHFPKLFDMGYNKVFFLDVDTMFFDYPDYFFRKYDSGSIWTLEEAIYNMTETVLGKAGINSGQVLISKKNYEKIPNFFKTLVKKRKELIKKGEKLLKSNKLTRSELEGLKFFSEQYCLQEACEEFNVPINLFSTRDIIFGGMHPDTYQISIRRNQVFVDTNVVILHYTSNWAYTVLPEILHTPDMTEKYRKDPMFQTKLLTPRYSTMV